MSSPAGSLVWLRLRTERCRELLDAAIDGPMDMPERASCMQEACMLAAEMEAHQCAFAGHHGQQLFIAFGRLNALLASAEEARALGIQCTGEQREAAWSRVGWLWSIARSTLRELEDRLLTDVRSLELEQRGAAQT